MFGIIRKEARLYFHNLLVFTAIQFIMPLISDFDHSEYSVMAYSFWAVLVAALSVMTTEHRERVDSGYSFLKTLPVTDAEVVAAKFLLPLTAVMIYAAVTWFHLLRLHLDPHGLNMARVWLMLNAAGGLAIAGTIYTLTFRFGMTRLLPVFGAVMAGVIGGYVVASEMMARGKLGHILPSLERVAGIGWAAVALAGLAVWFVLLLISIRIKRSCHV